MSDQLVQSAAAENVNGLCRVALKEPRLPSCGKIQQGVADGDGRLSTLAWPDAEQAQGQVLRREVRVTRIGTDHPPQAMGIVGAIELDEVDL